LRPRRGCLVDFMHVCTGPRGLHAVTKPTSGPPQVPAAVANPDWRGGAVIPVGGAVLPKKFKSIDRGFSRFEFMSERLPAESPRSGESSSPRAARLSPRAARVVEEQPVTAHHAPSHCVSGSGTISALDFKSQAMPSAPRGAGTFASFEYSTDPYETSQLISSEYVSSEASRIRSGPFRAGGDAQRGTIYTGGSTTPRRSGELRAKLTQEFSAELPSFLRITEDASGHMLVVFSIAGATAEKRKGIHSYMGRFAAERQVVADFKLARDMSRWGVVAGDAGDIVVYSLRPPWVGNDPHGVWRAAHMQSPRR